MAVAVPRATPWYALPRIGKKVREMRRLPLLPTFLLTFILIVPAIFANVIAPHDPEVGVLSDILVPPVWIKAKVQKLAGGFDFNDIQVFKEGKLVPNAIPTNNGKAVTDGGRTLRLVTFKVDGQEKVLIERALIYPGGFENKAKEKIPGLAPPENVIDFNEGGLWVDRAGITEEIPQGIAFIDGVTFSSLGATIHGRSPGDILDIRDADGNVVEEVVGRATMSNISLEGSKEEILANSGVVRQISPDGVSKYLLGTDRLGRDMVSRLIFAARVSLAVSLIAIFFAGLVGTVLGLVSGYAGGWVDALIMRLVDMMLSFPSILLALVLVAVVGASLSTVIIVIVLVLWAGYARLVRGETLSVKTREYVQRAKVAGVSPPLIILKHVFPNVLNSLLILATLQLGTVIIFEASLSFLGAGIPRPTAAWGVMIADGRQLIVSNWWVSFFPGMAILVVVLSLNLFGDWVRDKLDPRTRQI